MRPPFKAGNKFAKGHGRPPLPESVKQDRRDARQILKDGAPMMAARIMELANSLDPDVAIKAIKVGIDKVLPNLEEVENFEHRPLQQLTDEQVDKKLAELRSRRNGTHAGNGDSA